MNNEAIQRLREPAAWALLGAVAAAMLAALISITAAGGVASGQAASPASPLTVGLVLGAVVLVLTAPQKSPRTFAIVLTAMIELGVAALFGVISLIMGFVGNAGPNGNLAFGFSHFLTVAGHLAILVFAGLFLLRVFGDPALVPRNTPVGYPGAGQQPYPMTGAQQSYAQPVQGQQAPNQQVPGYTTGTHSAYPGYAEQGQQAATQTGWPQQGEGYAQPSGAQQSYAQPEAQPQAQSTGYEQQGYQAQAGYTGGQQPYGQEWQQSAGYGGQYQQQSYAQPEAQPSYGQPSEAQAAYGAGGGQHAYGAESAGYAQSGGQPSYGQQSEQQSAYGAGGQYQQGYPSGQQAAYGGYDAASSSGGYTAPGSADVDATIVQSPVPGASTGGSYASGEDVLSGERAAQDAIQHGWYPQTPAAEPVAEQQAAAGQRHDTPLESFFRSDEQNDSERTARGDSGQAGQYGSGGYSAQPSETTSPYGDNYGSDQQRRSSGEPDDPWQGQYRDGDRR